MFVREQTKENSMSVKEEILETIAEIQQKIEREIEWKITDYVSKSEVDVVLNNATFALDQVQFAVEKIEALDV